MWNNIGNLGNLTKILAEKAAAAAENIEGQLNESVGAPPEFLRDASKRLENNAGNLHSFPPIDETAASDDDDDDDDDPFNENDGFYEEDSFDVDMHDKKDSKPDQEWKNDVEASTENTESVQSVIVNEMESDHTTKEESVHENDGGITDTRTDESIYQNEMEQAHESASNNVSNVSEGNDLQECKHSSVVEGEEDDEFKADTFLPHKSMDGVEFDEGIPGENNRLDESINEATEPTGYLEEMMISPLSIEQKAECNLIPKLGVESTPSQEAYSILETEKQHNSEGQTLPTHSSQEESGKFFMKDHTIPSERKESSLNAFDTDLQGVSESDSEESIYVTKEEAMSLNPKMASEKSLQSQLNELKIQLQQREEQLASKSNQFAAIIESHEKEKSLLEAKLKETKEEAKKRIAKAREKVDDMKAKLAEVNNRASSIGSASSEQEKIIKALREEGEELAKKQSEMEQLVRDARGDIRDLKNELEAEKTAKHKAEESVATLERELKETKSELVLAKQKLAMTDKLESDLLAVREEKEKKSSIILGLEAKLKETLSSNNQLQKDMEATLKEKVAELEKETSSIRNEKDAILQDLESKLRLSEKEASLREDSLRHEVSELRKRWQEAVRRCDALSMDLQQSSAPLLRQLESAERQSRARSTAWAELEKKLRNDLEEMMLANENTLKEKHVLEAEISRSRVTIQVLESDRDSYLSKIKDMTAHLDDVLKKYDDVVSESETLKLEVQNLDNRLKNTEARVRVELLESMKEREERYNDLKASLEFQLQQERDYRISLERKIQEMVKVHDGIEEAVDRSEATSLERSLGNVTQQVHILSDALQSNEYSDDELLFQQDAIHQTMTSSPESFALVEQLTQTLKATKVERDALRKQLDESEDRRSSLEKEVVQAIAASEALREMECTVLQLTREVKEKDVEIKALQEDIDDVRKMYKDQLKSLLVDGDRASVSSNLQEGTKRGDESKPFLPSSFPGMRTF